MKMNFWKWPLLVVMLLTSFCLWSDIPIQSSSVVSTQWAGGYVLNVDVKNNSTNAIKGWTSTFTLSDTQNIDSLWSGQYVVSGKNVTVKNESWNGALQPGQTATFGMQISGSGTPGITNLKATGDDGSVTPPPPPPPPPTPLSVALTPNVQIVSTWTGGSQVSLELLNPSNVALNSWIVEFDLVQGSIISGLCGGEFTVTNSHVKVTSPLWVDGGNINAGGKATLSIILKSQNATTAPFANIVASGNPISNAEMPAAPILNSIINDDKDGNYTVSWSAVNGALRYTLQQSASSSFTNPITILTENTLQKIFQGQAAGTYYYRVAAIGLSLTGPYSNIQSVVVQNNPTPIGTPVLSQISNADLDGTYTVTWTAVENATGYVLEESLDGNFTAPVEVYNGPDTRKDFSFKPNGSYYYRVKAKNSSQIGSFSAAVGVIVNVSTPPPANPRKIIGYFPNWAMYRATPFYAKDININLVTHINYAFAPVNTDGTIRLFDPWSDTDFYTPNSGDRTYMGNFYQLYQLKKQKPGLKTLISIGGWTLSNTFSQMASTAASRDKFAQSCVDFCKKYDFDGIDIDWEYPCFADHSGHPEDKVNFTLLLQTVSAKLKAQNPPLLLSIAAPAGPNNYNNMEVAKIHQYLDWINIMGYDFHGPWGGVEDAVTNHLAPIMQTEFGPPLFNITAVLDYYLSQGVPKEKIILGLPMYGRSFAGAQDTPTGLYSTYTGPGYATTEEVGYVFFSDIQKNLLGRYTAYWDSKALGAYIYNPATKDFISYDNEQSWSLKAQIIKDRGLGGAMVWELGMDTLPDWRMMTNLNNQLK